MADESRSKKVEITDSMKLERSTYTGTGVDFLVSFDTEDGRRFAVVEWVGSRGRDDYLLHGQAATAETAWNDRGRHPVSIFNVRQWQAWLLEQTDTGCTPPGGNVLPGTTETA